MKALYFFLAASLLPAAVYAQQPPPPGPPPGNPPGAMNAEPRTFITAAEIADAVSQADAAAKAGTQYRGRPLLQSGPFRGGIEYHSEAATSFAVHENDSELFVVLDGSGTLTTGGTLVNPTRRGTNLMAPTINGGTPHKLAKGDMLLVPAGTPHAVTQVDGRLVMMSMHLPLPSAPPAAPPAPAPAP